MIFVLTCRLGKDQAQPKAHKTISLPNVLGLHTGTKAAIVSSIQVGDIQVSLVCAHLQAHNEHLHTRNLQYRRIMRKMNDRGLTGDVCIWHGDLNYRVEGEFSDISVKAAPENFHGDRQALLQLDQLKQVIAGGTAFGGFQEAPITFPPTFKYRDHHYDTDKKRNPSWCDRILWSTSDTCAIHVDKYTSCPEVISSDHKPVAAWMEIFSRQSKITKR